VRSRQRAGNPRYRCVHRGRSQRQLRPLRRAPGHPGRPRDAREHSGDAERVHGRRCPGRDRTFTITDKFLWTDGSMLGPGLTAVQPGAELLISDATNSLVPSARLAGGRTLDNRGTLRLTGYTGIRAPDDSTSTITNQGTVIAEAGRSALGAVFNNYGTLL